eukprot:3144229-Rhodomonas_salina.1
MELEQRFSAARRPDATGCAARRVCGAARVWSWSRTHARVVLSGGSTRPRGAAGSSGRVPARGAGHLLGRVGPAGLTWAVRMQVAAEAESVEEPAPTPDHRHSLGLQTHLRLLVLRVLGALCPSLCLFDPPFPCLLRLPSNRLCSRSGSLSSQGTPTGPMPEHSSAAGQPAGLPRFIEKVQKNTTPQRPASIMILEIHLTKCMYESAAVAVLLCARCS